MALKGTLKDFGIADIFQLIGVQQKNGILKLKDNDKIINVSFINGKIVGAESTVREKKEHLGEMLIRANLISKQDLTKALSYQKETLKRLGDILVKYEMIPPKDLKEMIQLQISETIYGLFKWTKGDYEFIQQNVEYDMENIEPVSAEQILMDGFRMLDEWPKVKRTIKSFDLVFQKTFDAEAITVFGDKSNVSIDEKIDEAFALFDEGKKKPAQKSGKKKLDQHENRIFALVDGKKTVQNIINLSRLGEFETCKILATLVEEGLIEIAAPEKRGREEKTKYNIIDAIINIIFTFLFIFIFFMITTSGSDLIDITNISTSYFFEVKKDDVLRDIQSLRRIDRLKNAVNLYYLTNNKYPQNLDSLIHENFLKESEIYDPWKTRYLYKATKDSFILERLGNRVIISK